MEERGIEPLSYKTEISPYFESKLKIRVHQQTNQTCFCFLTTDKKTKSESDPDLNDHQQSQSR